LCVAVTAGPGAARASRRPALALLLALALVAGCLFGTVREQQAKSDAAGTIAGTAAAVTFMCRGTSG
jgi:hypothetical protein